jgi:hypothetical protein
VEKVMRKLCLVALVSLVVPAVCLAESTVPADALSLVRADIAARGLPDADAPSAPQDEVVRADGKVSAPDGEALVVIRGVEELGGKGVALVGLESQRYWTLARPEGGSAVLNGPYSYGLDDERVEGLMAELAEAESVRQTEIVRQVLVTPGSYAQVDRILEGMPEGATLERTIGRIIHRTLRCSRPSRAASHPPRWPGGTGGPCLRRPGPR